MNFAKVTSKIIQKITSLKLNRGLFLILLIASAFSLVDFISYELTTDRLFIAVCFCCVCILKAFLLSLACLFADRAGKTWLKILAASCISLYIILCLINGGCWIIYGFGISRRLFAIAMETTPREIAEFIPGLTSNIMSMVWSYDFWIFIASLILLYYVISIIPRKTLNLLISSISLIGFISFTAFLFNAHINRTGTLLILRCYKYTYDAWEMTNQIKELRENLKPLPYKDKLSSTQECDNIIMIIGESALKGHWSLYGYGLSTTPYIEKLKDSIIVFKDAIGSSCGTHDNLKHILTFKPADPNTNEWYEYPNIVDLFNEIGYDTSWLSNQEQAGPYSNFSYAIAERSKHVNYVGATHVDDNLLHSYDEQLIPPFIDTFKDNTRTNFVILHLMGSHTWYASRYPKERAKISADDELEIHSHKPWINIDKARTISYYDNSIAFTDSILYQIIQFTSAIQQPSILFYFSDHGETVYDDKDIISRDRKCARIPFIVYANKTYREHYPEKYEKIICSASKPVSTADIIHTLLNISGSSYPLYDPTRDFLSDRFKPSVRYVDETPWEEDMKNGLPNRYNQ